MTLIRTSLLNLIAVAARMVALLGINKILAIYVGPAGYATLGQFQNFIQMIAGFASGAINTGVTKYTAQYHDDQERQRRVWRTAGTIALAGSIVVVVVISLCNQILAQWLLRDGNLGGVFLWFAATLVLVTFNALLLAILNGKKDVSRYVIANISGSVFALLVTAILAMLFSLYGALVALAIYQSLAFFVTLLICRKTSWFRFADLVGRIDTESAVNLGKYIVMALVSAACVPVCHVFIREHLGRNFGWEAAGYWEAMWRLSAAYLMVITTTLSLYYLPRLSELTTSSELKGEIIGGYKVILPIVAATGLGVYFFRDLIISVLFSKDFVPMRGLFAWQITGDVLKIGAWILSYLMLGKAMVKAFVSTEIVFSMSFFVLTVWITKYLGFEGVALAHAINYLAYWIVIGFVVVRSLKRIEIRHPAP